MNLLHQKIFLAFVIVAALIGCAGSDSQFTGWQTEDFGETPVTQSTSRTFTLANPSSDKEQHVRAIAFDRGGNTGGHFRIEKLMVGEQQVDAKDIVLPPSSVLHVTVAYAPQNLETTEAVYGGWATGYREPWTPRPREEITNEKPRAYHRALLQAVYDYPNPGIYYVQLVGEPIPGPNGEEVAGGGAAACTPGGGTACFDGGFSLDIPSLAPGGPKPLEITGPIRFALSGGQVTLRMDDFPYVIYYLRSSEIKQLPSGVTATLIISGAQGKEATGSFDGTRLTVKDVVFRIRVALGELSVDDVKQGISAMVDFEVPGLEITTIKPLTQGKITLHLETSIQENPSGNELFDQFLSGAKVIAFMEGNFTY